MRVVLLTVFVLLAAMLATATDVALYNEAPAAGGVVYTSAARVIASGTKGVNPPLTNCGPGGCEFYLGSSSALGQFGPISAYGPLGMLGPVGTNSWNPSAWISGVFSSDWSKYSKFLTGIGGALSDDGPLGSKGPLNPTAYYQTLPAINDFARHLQARGIFTVLGPVGPTGPLGPLGPLGPIGAHGYKANFNGQYTDGSGKVVRSVKAAGKTFELVENYREKFAKTMPDNDCSFMVIGSIDSSREVDTYNFKCAPNQFVTITLVPEHQLDVFGLTLDTYGIESAETKYINWIQISGPNGQLSASVRLLGSSQWLLSRSYRLIVTGSTSLITPNKATITGPHLAQVATAAAPAPAPARTPRFRQLARQAAAGQL